MAYERAVLKVLADSGIQYDRQLPVYPVVAGDRPAVHDFVLRLPGGKTAVVECKNVGSLRGSIYDKWFRDVWRLGRFGCDYKLLVYSHRRSLSDEFVRDISMFAEDRGVLFLSTSQFRDWLDQWHA